MRLVRSTRYYYWLVTGFLKKYTRIIVIVCVAAFFLLFLFKSYADDFAHLVNFNKVRIGVLTQGAKEKIPLEVLKNASTSIATYNKKGELVPQLAQKWDIDKEGKVFTFHFPKNISWDDNTPFSAMDIDLQSLRFSNVGVKVLDPYSIRFTLQKPLVNFPGLLSVPVVKRNLVGINGRYRLTKIKYDFGEVQSITLSPRSSGLPILIYKMYNTQEDLVLAYQI